MSNPNGPFTRTVKTLLLEDIFDEFNINSQFKIQKQSLPPLYDYKNIYYSTCPSNGIFDCEHECASCCTTLCCPFCCCCDSKLSNFIFYFFYECFVHISSCDCSFESKQIITIDWK